MARRKLIAGNWKMNKTVAETRAFFRELRQHVDAATDVDVLLCPTFTCLAAAVEEAGGSVIAVGAQNVHWETSGAFTGEISAEMLLDIAVEYAIIGHSERRQYFGETDATVNGRLKAALSTGLKPIVCVGETLTQREQGETQSVVRTQLEHGLVDITAEQMMQTVVAYEPVWAIGTGMTATPEQAQEVHAFVRSLLRGQFGQVAEQVRILYGGSVKPENAADLMGQPDIDGGLVGGASLDVEKFLGIIHSSG